MNKTARFLSLILVLALVFSCFCTEAFAADASSVKQYDSMFVMGDSVLRGCGLDGYGDYKNRNALIGLPGSAVDTVADACGVPTESRSFCTFPGQTLASALCLLGCESKSSDSFLQPGTWYADAVLPNIESFCGEEMEFDAKAGIAESELIVLGLGLSDIFYRSKEISYLEEAFTGEDGHTLGEALPVMLKEMAYGYTYVLANYDKLLDYVQEHKRADADVVIVGLYNVFGGLSAVEDLFLPVFEGEAAITGTVNAYLKGLAAKYGYMYADITNVPTPIVEQNLALTGMDDMNWAIHPSVESGLPYIARQIFGVLPAREVEQAKCKTTITVDLGFVEDVDYVLVDGVKSYNYTLEGNVLTVPHLTRFAKLLTVAAVDEHGKVTVQLYQLAYNDGYTAYRLLSNSDVVGTATKAVKTCVSTVKSLLGGLFKK